MKEISEAYFLDLLRKRSNEAMPLHVPGHKRNTQMLPPDLPWQLDVTEVPPFDNLHSPQGILQDCQNFAAEYWGSRSSFFLVGGSTAGILAGIRSCTRRGDGVVLARACHQSVYHALELCGLKPIYVDPPFIDGFYGSLSAQMVEEAILDGCRVEQPKGEINARKTQEHSQGKPSLVIITSPTYEGIISDVAGIAAVCHRYDIPLFVDAAHGAHLDLPGMEVLDREGPGLGFPTGAVKNGADLVVHGLHKTLPALTQTALLHVCSQRVSETAIQHQLSVFQSSSPSYPLMASIDFCNRFLAEEGIELAKDHLRNLIWFRKKMERLKNIRLFRGESNTQIYGHDPARILLKPTGLDGWTLSKRLAAEKRIKLELATECYALGITTLLDTAETFRRLYRVLEELDTESELLKKTARQGRAEKIPPALIQKIPCESAMQQRGVTLALSRSTGRISREYLWQYPPGIPIVTPGQEITAELIDWIQGTKAQLHSSYGGVPQKISVLPQDVAL